MQVKRVVQIWYLRRRISRPKVVRPVARGTTATSLPIGPVAWEPLTKMTNTWAIHQA